MGLHGRSDDATPLISEPTPFKPKEFSRKLSETIVLSWLSKNVLQVIILVTAFAPSALWDGYLMIPNLKMSMRRLYRHSFYKVA